MEKIYNHSWETSLTESVGIEKSKFPHLKFISIKNREFLNSYLSSNSTSGNLGFLIYKTEIRILKGSC